MKATHPDEEHWIRFVSGDVSDDDRRTMETHLGTCETCRESESGLRRMFGALLDGGLDAPSADALERARTAYGSRELPAALPGWTHSLARRFVRLVSDTGAGPALGFAGIRGPADSRRYRFEAEDLELDVLLETRGDRRRVVAQLLSNRYPVLPIASVSYFVTTDHRLAVAGTTDESGQILCETFEAGSIEICVAQPHQVSRFVIPEESAHS